MNLTRYTQIRDNEEKHWWYLGRKKLLLKLVLSIISDTKRVILDYGCGTGFNLELLQDYGEVWGADIEPLAIKYSKSRGIKKVVLVKKKKRLPFKNGQFEIITCLDVLEHVEEGGCLLDEFNRILKKKGYLIVFVPAYPILWGRLDNYSHHLRRYLRHGLIDNLSASGFKPIKVFYFNYFFFVPILMVRLFQRFGVGRKNDWGIHPVVRSNIWGRILEKIFYFDIASSMVISPPFGVSLAALCQKK